MGQIAAAPGTGEQQAEERRRASEHVIHRMPFGAEMQPDGSVRFAVWAPGAASMQVAVEDTGELLPMKCSEDGWHRLTTNAARAGSLYRFVLPGGLRVPDPASRFQPQDVDGPSEVINPEAYTWRSLHWNCCVWQQ